ncbi:hypothetical protein [Vagococcus silagei]|uniref:Uncharacterized protein n=1 Tax=Vagococcus silagei TaxID=2508885 RepID=A0A4S3B5D8_9ENTE|nr:hypothetical protein [Vagococcus silagei]THB62082.1 hypothetical protein ESZ54_02430 [Vagococcus silagei]
MVTNIFKASYEQSRQIVKISTLKGRNKETKRIFSFRFIKDLFTFLLLSLACGILMFGLAVGFPEGMATETNINIISIESARLIAKIGIVLKPIFLVCLALFLPLGIVNLLPVKNYPR